MGHGFDSSCGKKFCQSHLFSKLIFIEKCQLGEYSASGFAPCTDCPVGFYQDQVGQTQCVRCASDTETTVGKAEAVSACVDGGNFIIGSI